MAGVMLPATVSSGWFCSGIWGCPSKNRLSATSVW